MRGHHIYTRSWFELGSKTKNAGTYTVELTEGILGANTDDIIYNRLNPMHATVPEALAPRNSGQSLLRLFHIQTDTTVVSRSFFVTDEITGRGTVPYTFSLIFSEKDNEVFLKNPERAFEPDATEPYKSFAARISPDAPGELSGVYDPKVQDYQKPYKLSRDEWINSFGFNQDLFVNFYSSLCAAICDKRGSRIAVILPENVDSERLILSVLSLLPMFMKKKFGAASKWTGMMDGSGTSSAINGIQLLCYYNEQPISESNFPVIDLTGAGKHKYVDIKMKNYAGWVWENLENEQIRSEFELFLNTNFTGVVEKMPPDVVETCFLLWVFFVVNKIKINFDTACNTIRLVSESFAKNFNRYPFVSTHLSNSLLKILEEAQSEKHLDIFPELVQVVCLFAGNGEPTAKRLLGTMLKRFIRNREWKNLEVLLSYHARALLQPDVSADDENVSALALNDCLTCGDPNAARISQEAIEKYCLRKRVELLWYKDKSDEAFKIYMDYAFVLHTALNSALPERFFQLPEVKNPAAVDSERFLELELFDIKALGYSPGTAHWKAALPWSVNLSESRRLELFKLYYSKIGDNKRKYVHELEDTPCLQILLLLGNDVRNDIFGIYLNDFIDEWKKSAQSLSEDATWSYIKNWLIKIEGLSLSRKTFATFVRQQISLDIQDLIKLTGALSKDSMLTVYEVFTDNTILLPILSLVCNRIDTAALENRDFGPVVRELQQSTSPDPSLLTAAINRMLYWFIKRTSLSVEWALAVNAVRLQTEAFNPETYISMCRAKRGVSSKLYTTDDIIDVFEAVDKTDQYGFFASMIKQSFSDFLHNVVNTGNIGIFTSSGVITAFRRITDFDWKQYAGSLIISLLEQDREISSDFIDAYRIVQYNTTTEQNAERTHISLFYLALTALGAIFAISGLLLVVSVRNIAGPVAGSWLKPWILYTLTLLIAGWTAFSMAYQLRKRGPRK